MLTMGRIYAERSCKALIRVSADAVVETGSDGSLTPERPVRQVRVGSQMLGEETYGRRVWGRILSGEGRLSGTGELAEQLGVHDTTVHACRAQQPGGLLNRGQPDLGAEQREPGHHVPFRRCESRSLEVDHPAQMAAGVGKEVACVQIPVGGHQRRLPAAAIVENLYNPRSGDGRKRSQVDWWAKAEHTIGSGVAEPVEPTGEVDHLGDPGTRPGGSDSVESLDEQPVVTFVEQAWSQYDPEA